jgi:predicted ATPase
MLESIMIDGYKSIKKLSSRAFSLNKLNVLIGANGAGKSNFISFFKMLRALIEQNLQIYVEKEGGVDALLHYGRKETNCILGTITIAQHSGTYHFTLNPTQDNRFIFRQEVIYYEDVEQGSQKCLSEGHKEAIIKDYINHIDKEIYQIISSFRIYHFQDTGVSAKVKQVHTVHDNIRLKEDAANLAAFLRRLYEDYKSYYDHIVHTIQMAAPFFGGFIYRENVKHVELEWFEHHDPDTPLKAYRLSDGTLRFICLVTLLLQPDELSSDTILIDEPELGLHPYAINILAALLKRTSEFKQLIISTQSVELISQFNPEDIIVVDRVNDASTFKRLNSEELQTWLEDYSIGELWEKNIIGGRPT